MTTTAAAAPARAGVAGTVIAHAVLVTLLLLSSRRHEAPPMHSYEVTLVAAPAPNPAVHNVAPAALPTAAPKQVIPIKPAKVAKTVPVKPPPPPVETKHTDPAPATRAPVTPTQAPSTGQDFATVHQDGLQFPYPEYLKKIENSILKWWGNPDARPGTVTQVAFVILPNGTATSIEVFKSSRNRSYDDLATGAVESASNHHDFGPIPSGFTGSLPILFTFTKDASKP